ncbi:RAD55 family ATPase [[Eubacterium] cellulosolvens]
MEDNGKVVLTHIEGFDQYVQPGIPWGSVCLVAGGPGTLKTTFSFTLLYKNMKLNNLKGLYISLEQSKENLLVNMSKLGMDEIDNDSLEIADYGTLRLMLKKALEKSKKDLYSEYHPGEAKGLIDSSSNPNIEDSKVGINWMDDIQKLIRDRVEFGDVNLVVLDSLNGLYALSEFVNPRKELFHFFGFLREINVTTFLIVEALGNMHRMGEWGVEHFLADGIFELGIIEDREPMRYIQVKKIRGIAHDMNKYAFKVDNGIRVWGKLIDSRQKS